MSTSLTSGPAKLAADGASALIAVSLRYELCRNASAGGARHAAYALVEKLDLGDACCGGTSAIAVDQRLGDQRHTVNVDARSRPRSIQPCGTWLPQGASYLTLCRCAAS
jgi:hypothetical protein